MAANSSNAKSNAETPTAGQSCETATNKATSCDSASSKPAGSNSAPRCDSRMALNSGAVGADAKTGQEIAAQESTAQESTVQESTAQESIMQEIAVQEISVHKIMQRIRASVTEKLASPRTAFAPLNPASSGRDTGVLAGDLLHSIELRLINQRHSFSLDIDSRRIPASHRYGVLGRVITFLKRGLLVFWRDSIAVDYLRTEHEFNSALTKYLNTTTRYIDERDAADFAKLVHKIDVDSGKSVERIDRIADELSGSLAVLRAELRVLTEGLRAGAAHGSTPYFSSASQPLEISPAMSPQVVTLVEQINRLSARVDELALAFAEQHVDKTPADKQRAVKQQL